MGNSESSTEEEQIAKAEEEMAKEARQQKAEAEASAAARRLDVEKLTYSDLYSDEEDDDDDGPLEEYTSDEMDDDASLDGSYIPSSASVVSQIRPFSGSVSFVLSYNQSTATLQLKLTGTTDVPGKSQGGYGSYRINVALLPSVEEEFESKLRNGPNPSFDDTWGIKILKSQIANSVLRFRLFGCRDGGEAAVLLGENSHPLSDGTLRVPNPVHMRLTPKFTPIAMLETVRTSSQSARLSRLERHSLAVAQVLEQRRSTLVHDPAVEPPKLLALSAELLLNAAYHPDTGEFECVVQKAHGLTVPGKHSTYPAAFIRLQFLDLHGKEVHKSHTHVARKMKNPSFDETFVFAIVGKQIDEITLVVTAYEKRPAARKVKLGSFSMGVECSSEVEEQHWEEIVTSKGQRVARWHKFFTSQKPFNSNAQ